jgi:LPXTG-motif cell wall-anchored protein
MRTKVRGALAGVTLATGLTAVAIGWAPAGASVKDPGPVTVDFTATIVTADPAVPDLVLPGSATGTVDGSGNLAFPAAGFTMGSSSITTSGVTIAIQPEVTGTFTGTINPQSGVVSLTGSLRALLSNQALGLTNCPLGPFTLDLSTANAGGAAYSKATGAATITDPQFQLDPIALNTAGCNNAITGILNGGPPGLGPLPRADAGPIVMAVTFSPVLVEVPPAPGAPAAVSDAATTKMDTPVTIDVLANDLPDQGPTQLPLDVASLALATNPGHGTAAIVDGKVVYTPAAGYSGHDAFDYTLCSKLPEVAAPEIEEEEGGQAAAPVVAAAPCHTATVDVTVEAPVVTTVAPTPTTAAGSSVLAASAELPRTGRASAPLALLGLALLATGAVLATTMRRPHIVR